MILVLRWNRLEELERAQGWRGLVSRGRMEALPPRLRGGMPADIRGAPCRRWIIHFDNPRVPATAPLEQGNRSAAA